MVFGPAHETGIYGICIKSYLKHVMHCYLMWLRSKVLSESSSNIIFNAIREGFGLTAHFTLARLSLHCDKFRTLVVSPFVFSFRNQLLSFCQRE